MRTFGSLFAGVGGFDMGFEQAGFDCRFQVEWDKHCQSVLNRHWPDVPKWGDVCDVDGSWLPHVDVLIFGSPCQDLSVAGKRSGLDGGRSSMFFEAIRIIKEMRNATGNHYPRVVVWENVPGALTSNQGADFGAVLQEMADCGSLLTEWAVLDAQHFGVPQRRRRIFLVAVLDPATADRCPNPLFPVSQGRRGDYEKGIPKGQTAAGTPTESIGSCDEPDELTIFENSYRDGVRLGKGIAQTLSAKMGTGGNNTPMIVENNAYSIREDAKANTFSATPTDTALCVNAVQPSVQSHHAQLFIAQTAIPIQDGREIEKRQNGLGVGTEGDPAYTLDTLGAQAVAIHSFDTQFGSNANVFNDMSPTLKSSQNAPSVSYPVEPPLAFSAGNSEKARSIALTENGTPPLKAGASGTNQVPTVMLPPSMLVRRLTPVECERLMGWPDDHTRWTTEGKEQSDSARYKQCGNGVATPVAKWIAQQLEQLL